MCCLFQLVLYASHSVMSDGIYRVVGTTSDSVKQSIYRISVVCTVLYRYSESISILNSKFIISSLSVPYDSIIVENLVNIFEWIFLFLLFEFFFFRVNLISFCSHWFQKHAVTNFKIAMWINIYFAFEYICFCGKWNNFSWNTNIILQKFVCLTV